MVTTRSVLVVQGNGNVGINNPYPIQTLDVNGIIAVNNYAIRLREGDDFHDYLAYSNVVNGPKLNGYDGGVLSTDSGNMLYWNSSGNIGIGLINPLSQLANTNGNIIASTGQGVNTQSLTWEVNNDGYALALFNGNLASYSNGLAVKIAYATRYNYFLELSTGDAGLNPGVPVFSVRGDGLSGFGTDQPKERVTINGAVKISDGGYTGIINNAATPVPAGGAGTIVFSGNHFYGWNGTVGNNRMIDWQKLVMY